MAPKRKTAPEKPIPGSVSDSDTGANQKNNTIPDTQEAQKTISFDTAADPELNPSSPEFNAARYREYLSTLDLSELEHRLQRAVTRANDSAAAAALEINTGKIIPQAISDAAAESLAEIKAISEWANQTATQSLIPLLRRLFDAKDTLNSFSWKTFTEALQENVARRKALEPYLEKELPKLRKNAGMEEITSEELLAYISLDGRTITEPEDGTEIPEPILKAIVRAIAAAERASLPAASATRAEIIEYPLDKVNSNIWSLLQDTPPDGQLQLGLNMAKTGSKTPVPVYLSIDFSHLEEEGLHIAKKLTPFDKRVYVAVSALYNAKVNPITLTQIHYAMGNIERPARSHLMKIQNSIKKMKLTEVWINNIKEAEVYNYEQFPWDGTLLPCEKITAVANGKITDAAILLYREPPVISFAKERKQITTITVKVLQSPISKTDSNLLMDDYLIERICRAKRNGQSCKILYETLYEHAQITTYKQKARAPEKIKTYLDHYKACGMIAAYKMGKDGIQIEF